MKQAGFLSFVLVALVSFTCSGCLFFSNSPAPRFYTLHSTVNSGGITKLDIAPKLIIGIGPVEVPEYQNRPQIVTRDKGGLLTFAQFERWGESLDSGIERLILENLTEIFPQADFQMFPCNFSIPLDYQVLVNIVQLESQLDKDVLLIAQWTIIDLRTKEMLLTKRSQVLQEINPHTYSGLAQALSKACLVLSEEIARSLSELSFQPEVKHQPAQ
jgi:uncharacterized protein